MRIISGEYRGRRIEVSSKLSVRPTTDFAKEGLFNILEGRIRLAGARVLDLFAGTGSIGYECISRGAASVTSVELARGQQNFIIRQCKILGIEGLQVVRGDVFKYLNECRSVSSVREYDLIFADPPYSMALLNSVPDAVLSEPSILRGGGVFVLEHSRFHNFESHPLFSFERVYGNVHFSFFSMV